MCLGTLREYSDVLKGALILMEVIKYCLKATRLYIVLNYNTHTHIHIRPYPILKKIYFTVCVIYNHIIVGEM